MRLVKRNGIWLILDNEGVQTLGDNAYQALVEAAKMYLYWARVVPEIIIVPSDKEKGMTLGEIIGSRFFRAISNIDDRWGDFKLILKDPTYSAGHTLKVILPFLIALGVTSRWMEDFAYRSIRLMPSINKVLPSLTSKYNVRMVSTSYEFYIWAFCKATGFDFAKADCTFVRRFDEISITLEEQHALLTFMKQVAAMPLIEYDGKTGELGQGHQIYYDTLTDFIWKTVYDMPIGELLRTVHPVGQAQKREAVERIIQEEQVSLEDVMGVGDSQTDLKWVELLKGRGLSLMFNGKGNVFKRSDLAYIGGDFTAVERVADIFAEKGRQGVIDYYTPLQREPGGFVAAITPENIGELESLSLKKRGEVRGELVAGLS